MGYIAGIDKGGLARVDASPFCRVYERVAVSRFARMHELGGRPSTFGEGVV